MITGRKAWQIGLLMLLASALTLAVVDWWALHRWVLLLTDRYRAVETRLLVVEKQCGIRYMEE